MSWWPDSGWLRALDLRTSTFAAVALGCWAVFCLAEFDLLYLGALPPMARAVFVILALGAFLLWLGRLWDLGFAHLTGWRQRLATLALLDSLSTSEEALLRSQLEKNEQTFPARFDDRVAAGLQSKGLALRSDTGHLLGYPHTIPDFVWTELRRRWKVAEKPEIQPETARSRVRRARAGLTGRGAG